MRSSDSEKEIIASLKQCGMCGELMPLYEMVCYCSGPIKIVRADRDMVEHSKRYALRRQIFIWKKGKES